MNSRVSLSILAAVTGACLMYLFLTFFDIKLEAKHTTFSRIVVLVGILCVVVGWIKVFRYRSNKNDPGQS